MTLREVVRGLVDMKIYHVWQAMKQRCYNPKATGYHNYGGRGIIVCERWRNDFWEFWVDMEAGYQEGLSLDRINNDGNYEPSNCRWATASQQRQNQGHEIITLKEILDILNENWRNNREFLLKASKQECLSLFISKFGKEFIFDPISDSYILEKIDTDVV